MKQTETQEKLVAAQMAVRKQALDIPSAFTFEERLILEKQYHGAIEIGKQTKQEIAGAERVLETLEKFVVS